jgi:methylase of polypeptide subunit release factors
LERNYVSREDSVLLRKALESFGGGRALEIGVGNGSNLKNIVGRFEIAVGTDLYAELAKNRMFDVIMADRASCFREDTFDLVFFNPPYLPSDSFEDRAVDGGKGGIEVPISFLSDAERVSTREGKILVVLSSDSDTSSLCKYCENHNLRVSKYAEEASFFEKLYVFIITKQ